MTVRISDIIVPEIFAEYVIERTAEKSNLWRSGLIEQNDKTNEIASGGGTTANMPFFSDLTGDSEVLSDATPLSVNGIATSKDVCVINHRGKAWGANDLAKAKSGDDPMAAIGDLVADWWGRDMQKTLIAILRGVFASTAMAAEHVLNISIADGNNAAAGNLISSGATVNALKKLGDQLDAISAIAMHSDIYYELVKQDEIEFEQPSEQDTVIQRYKGRAVIVDDSLPKVAGGTSGFVYSTYMFGEGAFAYGEGTPEEEAVEMDRDILAGTSYLTNRRKFIIHPVGVKWKGTAAAASPSNAEYATAANWERVYTRRNVRLICLQTNG